MKLEKVSCTLKLDTFIDLNQLFSILNNESARFHHGHLIFSDQNENFHGKISANGEIELNNGENVEEIERIIEKIMEKVKKVQGNAKIEKKRWNFVMCKNLECTLNLTKLSNYRFGFRTKCCYDPEVHNDMAIYFSLPHSPQCTFLVKENGRVGIANIRSAEDFGTVRDCLAQIKEYAKCG